MKKSSTVLLLCLLLFALAGCNSKQTSTPLQEETISGEVLSETENSNVTPTPIPPTPTPEGNFVAFHLDSGFYDSNQKVSLSCNVEGAAIYYTTDGSTPTDASNLYKGEITVSRQLYTPNVLASFQIRCFII